jgi:hypothetical protein
MKMIRTARLFILLALTTSPAFATHPCTSPLVLDLDGDGVLTYGVDAGVSFDITGDGALDRVGWTNPFSEEGFLWIDLDKDGQVSGGGELFGTATVLPDGTRATNGFEALRVYDAATYGGNGDHVISKEDLIWPVLRIWVDSNQDGLSQPWEVGPLPKWGVYAIELTYEERDRVDGTGSVHRFEGRFLRRVKFLGAELLRVQRIEDVYFPIAAPD